MLEYDGGHKLAVGFGLRFDALSSYHDTVASRSLEYFVGAYDFTVQPETQMTRQSLVIATTVVGECKTIESHIIILTHHLGDLSRSTYSLFGSFFPVRTES